MAWAKEQASLWPILRRGDDQSRRQRSYLLPELQESSFLVPQGMQPEISLKVGFRINFNSVQNAIDPIRINYRLLNAKFLFHANKSLPWFESSSFTHQLQSFSEIGHHILYKTDDNQGWNHQRVQKGLVLEQRFHEWAPPEIKREKWFTITTKWGRWRWKYEMRKYTHL